MTVTANLLTAREAVETAGMMMPASADEMYCSLNAKSSHPPAASGNATMKIDFQ